MAATIAQAYEEGLAGDQEEIARRMAETRVRVREFFAARESNLEGGTGDFGVASAVQGYRTPAAASVPNGAVGGYRAESSDLTQWEIGVFTYSTTGPTVARTTVLSNSLGTTAKISFTAAPNVGFVELSQDLTNASLLLTGTVDAARLRTLSSLGFNRLSFGVQDFDPDVQKAVHRIQPFDQVRDLMAQARERDFDSIN
ncbi:hypothetical protein KXX47_009747, partial [Aspergillus fumigatus]